MRFDVALISCGSSKAAVPQPARSLYTSGSFRSRLRVAELAAPRVAVLSALHALLALDQLVDPYDFKITQHTGPSLDRWRALLLGLAGGWGGAGTRCLVLASAHYVDAARPVLAELLRWELEAPLVGLSQGRAAQLLKKIGEELAR